MLLVAVKTSVPSVIQCSEGSGAHQEHSSTLNLPPTLSNATPTVLKRELLSPQRPTLNNNAPGHEEADLILQLGTVVTTTLNRVEKPSKDPVITFKMDQQSCRTEARSQVEQPKYKANSHPSYHFVLQDHNYGAPPPPTPPLSPSPAAQPQIKHNHLIPPPLSAHDLSGIRALATVADQMRSGVNSLSSMLMSQDDNSRGSMISSGDEGNDRGLEGEETETAAEGEGDEDSVTRCICDFEHDDGYMICCDKCLVWQHVDCMGIDRNNIPEEYLCEQCQPRRVDRTRARNLQLRKQMHNDTSSSDDEHGQANKAGPPNQFKKLGNNSGVRKRPVKKETKKVVKRQKRDSAAVAAREQRANERRNNKKKELNNLNSTPIKTDSKKIAGRRRSKGKPESVDEDTQDCWTSNVPLASQPQQLRQWIEQYEEAVTNHYSPELRARIQAIKVNGIHSDFKVGPVVIQKCRTVLGDSGSKVLLAAATLQANQPIMEVRGKFMLAAQHSVKKAQLASPYLLFYQLPKENTEICVDARTYGNDARFVRRSCCPNAEVKHCIEKGALHLYLVAASAIEKNQEITIKHDEPVRIPCKNCPPLTPNLDIKKNGHAEVNVEKVERRRRASRRNTEESIPDLSPAPPVLQVNTPSPTLSAPAITPNTAALAIAVPSAPPNLVVQLPQSTPKKPPKSPVKQMPTPEKSQGEDSNDEESPGSMNSPDKRKMTREERKMEAIMKAFERLEKQEQRKQAQQHHRRSERDSKDSDSSGRFRDEADMDLEIQPVKKKGRRIRGRSSSGASSQVLSADENSSGSHLVLSPGSASASASPRVVSSPPPLGFKFPKTKKVLMNEWLNKPEPPLSPLKLEDGDGCVGGAAAAKKRWLRQAISEESEPIPSSSPRSVSPDYVTPLKKRRLARESLEQQQSYTPPATTASPEPETEVPKPAPNLPLRCVEEAVLALSGHIGIKIEPKESLPPVLSPPPAIPISASTVMASAPELNAVAEIPLLSLAPNIPSTPTSLPLSLLANPVPPPPPPLPESPVKAPREISQELQLPAAISVPPPPAPVIQAPVPAAVKRKLSISEYRQRNKQKVDKPELAAFGPNSSASIEDQAGDMDNKTEVPRWNSEPTSSEKQRENLTERLKREFGLFLDEQERGEKEKVEEVNDQVSLLPPLPPLEPPQPKLNDSLNIPLPSSPPPLLDLLVMESAPPLLLEAPTPNNDEEASLNGPSRLLIKSQTPAKMKASSKKIT
ncbi:inactive histone-lysine N-methyltransferase 2E [Neocloeon triangulifer]|uniref:inactive histone-lysine N-methyltransferase 2E n=1 Tax=Neocloeon triangulifer TaxID=2078957 RepID=UPI00286F5F2F|nr:inactive histone-lysine N-methyltransferase 2E [Neocloeon triangulifer]